MPEEIGMKLRTTIASAVGALALTAAAAYAPAASADRVGFNLTLGGPGYAVNVGNFGYGYYDHWRPAPVVVAPYAPYYRPYRPYYAPAVVVRPYPVHRPYYGYRHDGYRHDGYRHGGYRHGGYRHDGYRHDGRHRDRPVGYIHYER